MVLNGWAKWGHYLGFSLLLWMSLQNVGIVLPGHDFEMTFMPVPVNAHAWAWVISVMFLKHLGTNSMQDPLLNVSKAIKGRKRGKEQRFVEYSMESRGWNATLNYSWLEISWEKKKVVALHPRGHFKGYHHSSGPVGALATGGEGDGAPLSGDRPGDHPPGVRGGHVSNWAPEGQAPPSKWKLLASAVHHPTLQVYSETHGCFLWTVCAKPPNTFSICSCLTSPLLRFAQ